MRRGLIAATAVLLLLIAGAGLVIGSARPQNGPIYSLAQLHAALAKNAFAWVGRTVLIRGTAGGADRTDSPHGPVIALRDFTDANGLQPPLLLHPEIGHGLIPSLRHVPLLGAVLPAAQTIRETESTYRIRVQAFGRGTCRGDVFSCYYGVLLDADVAL
jgi:hypothetical protein